jgi:hypothetical protein
MLAEGTIVGSIYQPISHSFVNHLGENVTLLVYYVDRILTAAPPAPGTINGFANPQHPVADTALNNGDILTARSGIAMTLPGAGHVLPATARATGINIEYVVNEPLSAGAYQIGGTAAAPTFTATTLGTYFITGTITGTTISRSFLINVVPTNAVTNINVPSANTSSVISAMVGLYEIDLNPNLSGGVGVFFPSDIKWDVVAHTTGTIAPTFTGSVIDFNDVTQAGSITVRGTVENGVSPGVDYVKVFTITVVANIPISGVDSAEAAADITIGSGGSKNLTIIPQGSSPHAFRGLMTIEWVLLAEKQGVSLTSLGRLSWTGATTPGSISVQYTIRQGGDIADYVGETISIDLK